MVILWSYVDRERGCTSIAKRRRIILGKPVLVADVEYRVDMGSLDALEEAQVDTFRSML